MTFGEAIVIFKDIYNEDISIKERVLAIKGVSQLVTASSIRKDEFINALKWIVETFSFPELPKNEDCLLCMHHVTGKCDTICDHGEAFEMRQEVEHYSEGYKKGYEDGKRDAVVHGRWTYYSTTMQECTNCHRHTARHRFEYCPHCGAKMDGKEE